MTTRILVISDLHLGGAEGFQICPEKGRARLVGFINWAAAQISNVQKLMLVVNGDFVDFLAEPDPSGAYCAFNGNEDRAVAKFNSICGECADVFAALHEYLQSGGHLTLLLGNHDIELSLPRVRQELMRRLGDGLIDFIYDNQAFVIGPVLIEHGNRYDAWNMVNHNQLREIRSRMSRRESSASFAAQPGSELVARVMNPLKEKFAFVDLLKPETGAVVPILAVLDPIAWRNIDQVMLERVATWWRDQFDVQHAPAQGDFVAASKNVSVPIDSIPIPLALSRPFELANDLIADIYSSVDDRIGWVDKLSIPALVKAFHNRQGALNDYFAVDIEDKLYLDPAASIAKRGFEVVVFGHTHLAKSVSLSDSAVYLNTGTWADIMCLPCGVFSENENEACLALNGFLSDVRQNRIDSYRRQIPTFACINLDSNDEVKDANVFFFDGQESNSIVTTAAMLNRLA